MGSFHQSKQSDNKWYAVEVRWGILDQYQYLGNYPPTPPLTQQQSIDNKLMLMLG